MSRKFSLARRGGGRERSEDMKVDSNTLEEGYCTHTHQDQWISLNQALLWTQTVFQESLPLLGAGQSSGAATRVSKRNWSSVTKDCKPSASSAPALHIGAKMEGFLSSFPPNNGYKE